MVFLRMNERCILTPIRCAQTPTPTFSAEKSMKIAGRMVSGRNTSQCVQLQGIETHGLSADLPKETTRMIAMTMNQTKSAQNARVRHRQKRLKYRADPMLWTVDELRVFSLPCERAACPVPNLVEVSEMDGIPACIIIGRNAINKINLTKPLNSSSYP